jgi:hypothetical protein
MFCKINRVCGQTSKKGGITGRGTAVAGYTLSYGRPVITEIRDGIPICERCIQIIFPSFQPPLPLFEDLVHARDICAPEA